MENAIHVRTFLSLFERAELLVELVRRAEVGGRSTEVFTVDAVFTPALYRERERRGHMCVECIAAQM